ncbi:MULTISPECIES: hypothetical protein [unclassified Streptomyces]|uniref:hypothetical protein n=1 Tax=unclassified Streptomyces TaxID=2593676 RepID=UPI00278C4B31|nr:MULTISPECIES: hypothetical protein [unclassified Streptomyces]
MADEHNKWLSRDAADRLLRGEPPAVSGDAARQAERLAAALHALSEVQEARTVGPKGELPGEDAALKAFRDARDASAVTAVNSAVSGVTATASASASAAGRGERRTRWGRPARFGLAAAVAACMLGGVAVAAGTGVLPSPFREADDPAPAASVSAAASPDRPLSSASAGVTEDGHVTPEPTKSPGAASGEGSASGSASHGDGEGDGTDERHDGRTSQGQGPKSGATGDAALKAQGRRLVDACRKYRGGQLGGADVRRLQATAKSLGQSPRTLGRFCDRVIARAGSSEAPADKTASQRTDNKSDSSGAGSESFASDSGGGNGGGSGNGKGDGDSDGDGSGGRSGGKGKSGSEDGSGGDADGADATDPSATASPSPSPSPTSTPSR